MTEEEEFEFRLRLEQEMAGTPKKESPKPTEKRSLVQELFQGMKTGLTNFPSAMISLSSGSPELALARASAGAPEVAPISTEQVRQQAFGVTSLPAQTMPGRYAQAVGESVADPISYLFGGGSIPYKIGMNVVTGLGGQAGGDLGAETERALTGKEGSTGRVLGSLAGGIGAGQVYTAQRQASGAAMGAAKQVFDKRKAFSVNPDAAELSVAQGSAKRILEQAAKAQGADNIETLLDEVKDASVYVTGKPAPLLIGAAENPVLRAEVIRLAKTNPAFRQRIDEELKNLAKQLETKTTKIFGERGLPISRGQGLSIQNAQARIREIDNKIEKLSDPFVSVNKTDIGTAVENLVEAKKAAVKKELGPLYDDLLKEAREANVKLPEKATQELYTFVEANKIRDIFGRGTRPERSILRLLSPEETLKPGTDPNIAALERAAGFAAPTEQKFSKLTFDDIDSLKKDINSELRRVKDATQRDKLSKLKEFLDDVRDQYVPGKYNDALKDLDLQYYERLGVPFGKQGIKDIDSAKYASQVAPVILKNRQAYQDFIQVAGEQGKQIAANALIAKAHDAILKEGIVAPKAVQTFIKQNKEVLDELPEVKQLLQESAVDATKLTVAKARLNAAAEVASKRIADNWITGQNYKDFDDLTTRWMSSTGSRNKLKADLKDVDPDVSKAVIKSIRAEVVNKALTYPGGAGKFLTDPTNRAALNDLMGKDYQASLAKLGKLSDALNKADISKLSIELDRSQLDTLGRMVPGLDIPYVSSTLRDRISSPIQKAIRLLSRVNVKRLQETTDQEILNVLLDPEGVRKLAATADSINFNIKSPVELKKVVASFYEALPASVYTSLQTADIEQEPMVLE